MIEKILKHIKQDKKWQDDCYWLNSEDDLSAIVKWYYYEVLGWCGCGCPSEAMKTIAKYLEARNMEYPASDEKMKEYFGKDGDENPLVMCLAYTLDEKGFTDHGSSILSCWLTDDGKYFLWAIKEAERQDMLDI